jgi:hypothetical protein
MNYQKFLVLFSILLAIPIVKADGCGIVCPKGANDLLTFSLATLCNFFTWSFCHIFAFIIVAIAGIVIFIFWHQQKEEKKKTIKLFLFALFGIFALILLYPYIKAWVYTPVSVPTDSCGISNTVCVLDYPLWMTSHTPTGSHSSNSWTLVNAPLTGTAALVGTGGIILTPDICDVDLGGGCSFTATNITANVEYTVTAEFFG